MNREKINWSEIIKAGNTVKVRQWEDMVKEFGVTLDCAIDCFKKFTEYMKSYCGETIKIDKDMEKNLMNMDTFIMKAVCLVQIC